MKTAFCSLLLLCSCLSFGQTVPQWKVVKAVLLNHRTIQIPETTLFTPSENSLYRLSGYMVAKNLDTSRQDGWVFSFTATDFLTQTPFSPGAQVLGSSVPANIGPYVFTALKGTPITYRVFEDSNPPPDAEYVLAFTIEQLK